MKIFFQKLIVLATIILVSHGLFGQDFEGYAMYTENNNAYLIDEAGNIAHRWICDERANYSMFLKENGHIVRGAVNRNNIIRGPAVGGTIQELDPNGNVVWQFDHSSANYVAHHDITEMPNGGVLITAWEVLPLADLQAMGFQGTRALWPTHLLEIQQDGTGGKVVWEWHMEDHFIQDVDPSLDNYGVISDNPQLMDINVESNGGGGGPGPGGGDGDWFHVNGVDYDEKMDQIIFSSRYLSEIYIIDHSTTTEEAAGHTGGNSGKGGDFLWRWGNPANYKTVGQRLISAAVHDPQIVPNDGRLYGDFVQVFNNGGIDGRTQVDNLQLPRDGFNFFKEAEKPYGPTMATFSHITRATADGQSASHRLSNNNLYVNISREFQYEVDFQNNLIWQYPDAASKGFRVECDHPGVQALEAQGFLDSEYCESVSSTTAVRQNPFTVSPNPSSGLIFLDNIHNESNIDHISVTTPQGQWLRNFDKQTRTIDLSDLKPAVYFLSIHFQSGTKVTKRIIITR